MRRDFVSPTLSKPQSLGLFPTFAYCDTFISKFLPSARILKMGFPMSLTHLHTSITSEMLMSLSVWPLHDL